MEQKGQGEQSDYRDDTVTSCRTAGGDFRARRG